MLAQDPNFPDNLDIRPSILNGVVRQGKYSERVFGVEAQEDAIRLYGIAGRVWEAAYALSAYVSPPSDWNFEPPFVSDAARIHSLTMIELGSGSGLVASGIIKTLEPRDLFIATDLPEVCPLLYQNICSVTDGNGVGVIRPLSWGNVEHVNALKTEFFSDSARGGPTHIICSDLVYFPELLAPLLRTLLSLSSLRPCTGNAMEIIFSYKIRSLAKESLFWSALGLWFKFEPVIVMRDGEEWRRFGSDSEDPTFIFVASRRANSYTWLVPDDDNDLLHGVGAHGTASRKGDETFESLLLMSLDEGEVFP